MDNIISMFLWSMLQNKLQNMGINTQGVNFNDMNSLNEFAKKIMPDILKNNPQMKEWIKQNAPAENKDEVVQVVDNI